MPKGMDRTAASVASATTAKPWEIRFIDGAAVIPSNFFFRRYRAARDQNKTISKSSIRVAGMIYIIVSRAGRAKIKVFTDL